MHSHDSSKDLEISFLSKENFEVCLESPGITLMDGKLDIIFGFIKNGAKVPKARGERRVRCRLMR